jgi:hypothetical protein
MYLQASLMVHARLAALPQIFAQPDRRLAQRAVHTGEAAIKMIERDSGLARSIRIGFQV